MASNVKPVPDGYHSVTPYLIVQGANRAIDFYRDVFAAQERMRMPMEDGRIGHAELTIGDSIIMLADESPEMSARSPQTVGGTPVGICVYVDDVDWVVDKAVSLGSKLERPVADQFYGDRSGTIVDPFGHRWYVMTHIEDLTPEEMERRMTAGASS